MQTRTASTPPAIVKLERTAKTLRVSPVPQELTRLLLTKRLATEAAGPHGYAQHAVLLPLYHRDQTAASLRLASTLQPAVEVALQRAGRTYQTSAYDMLPPLPPAVRANLSRLGVVDEPLFALIAAHPHGLVRYEPGMVQPEVLVAQLALAYPTHRFLIAAARIDDVNRLVSQLRTLVSRTAVTRICDDDNPTEVGRIAVGTFVGLIHTAVELEQREFLIYLDAREGVSTRGLLPLRRAWNARVIGLLPTTAHVAPLEADQLRAAFGFAEAFIPRHNHHERSVHVAPPLAVPGQRLPMGKTASYALKRDGIWHHHGRNGLLVREAKRAARRVMNSSDAPGRNERVVLLVDHVEHALALGRRLADWLVLVHEDCCTAGLMQQAQRRLRMSQEQRLGDWRCAIVTPLALPAIDLATVDTLLRADGGSGLPAIPAAQLVVANDQPTPPLRLVDVQDLHHVQLRQWTRCRQRAYRERGWLAYGVDPIVARAEEFLDARPDVRALLAE